MTICYPVTPLSILTAQELVWGVIILIPWWETKLNQPFFDSHPYKAKDSYDQKKNQKQKTFPMGPLNPEPSLRRITHLTSFTDLSYDLLWPKKCERKG